MSTILNIIILCAVPVLAVDAFFCAVLIGVMIENVKERWRK